MEWHDDWICCCSRSSSSGCVVVVGVYHAVAATLLLCCSFAYISKPVTSLSTEPRMYQLCVLHSCRVFTKAPVFCGLIGGCCPARDKRWFCKSSAGQPMAACRCRLCTCMFGRNNCTKAGSANEIPQGSE